MSEPELPAQASPLTVWGASLWFVLTADGLELAGTGDIEPVPTNFTLLEELLHIQRSEGDGLSASIDRALAVRGVTFRTIIGPQTLKPLHTEESPSQGSIELRYRPVFRAVNGRLFAHDLSRGGLVGLDYHQRRILTRLSPTGSVVDVTEGSSEAGIALAVMQLYGLVHLLDPPIGATSDALETPVTFSAPHRTPSVDTLQTPDGPEDSGQERGLASKERAPRLARQVLDSLPQPIRTHMKRGIARMRRGGLR